uniref:Uncharacterized protein n=1 Tax=Anguilla anguilla TaxID=7936 RepID=A0A0E9UPH8_ANGAN
MLQCMDSNEIQSKMSAGWPEFYAMKKWIAGVDCTSRTHSRLVRLSLNSSREKKSQ